MLNFEKEKKTARFEQRELRKRKRKRQGSDKDNFEKEKENGKVRTKRILKKKKKRQCSDKDNFEKEKENDKVHFTILYYNVSLDSRLYGVYVELLKMCTDFSPNAMLWLKCKPMSSTSRLRTSGHLCSCKDQTIRQICIADAG